MQKQERMAYLDGLRGFAALSVVLFHFLYMFQPAAIFGSAPGRIGESIAWLHGHPLYGFFSGGFAVSLFFVLSGFVLSLPFCLSRDRSLPLTSMMRRYPRLMLPILGSNLLFGVLLATGLMNNDILMQVQRITGTLGCEDLYTVPLNWFHLIRHALWDVFRGISYDYNPVLWTMHIELVGSFLVFGLLALVGNRRERWWVYGLLSLVGLWRYPIYLAFLLGLVLCELYVRYPLTWLKSPALQLVLLAVAFYLSGIPTHLISFYEQTTLYHWVSQLSWLPVENRRWLVLVVAAVCVIAVTLKQPKLQALLEGRAGRLLGQISFGLYLTHEAVIFTATTRLFLWLGAWLTPSAAAFTALFLSLPLCIGVGWLLYRWVDIPAIRLSKAVSNRLCRALPGRQGQLVPLPVQPGDEQKSHLSG